MIRVAIALAVVVIAIINRVWARGAMRRHATGYGWAYSPRADELAGPFTLPPFVALPSFGVTPMPESVREQQVRDAVRFMVQGSEATAFTFVETIADQQRSHMVVALRTAQRLPRTMIRAGIDVYVLPAYEGMHRVTEPKVWVRNGLLSILSEDPRATETLPIRAVRTDLELDQRMTLVADGDWLYAYRPGRARPWRIEPMLRTLRVFARDVEQPPWPGPENPTRHVYGAV